MQLTKRKNMKKQKVPVIKQEEGKEVPVEVLASEIKAISAGVKKLLKGPIKNKAIYLLVQNACPTIGSYPTRKVGMSEVRAVIEGLERLEAEYLK